MNYFVFAVALLGLGAAGVYAYRHQWALSIAWAAYAVAAGALGAAD